MSKRLQQKNNKIQDYNSKQRRLRVLAIGDLTNNIATLKKFVNSDIHLINFSWDGASKIIDDQNDIEFFNTDKISEIVQKINSIKNEYDVTIAMSPTGILVSYLADLNYIIFFVGDDIKAPPYIKDVKDPYATNESLYKFNNIERIFYKKAYDNAVATVLIDDELEPYLRKYTNHKVRISGYIMDTQIFNDNIEPLDGKKEKFTFLSPQRLDPGKGIDKIWDALKLCKSDFEVLQIKWYNNRIPEEIKLAKKWIDEKPKQVKFIPTMKKEELARYYDFADGVIGQMQSGFQGYVEKEASLLKKPVIHYVNPNHKYIIDGKNIQPPFLPNSSEPKEIARIIDKVVEDDEFRNRLAKEGYEYIKSITDSEKISKWWDRLFQEICTEYEKNVKNSSGINLKVRLWTYLIANRLYVRKFRKLLKS